ncbi:MAG: hypothetical protein K6L80_04705 [Agarilytica sp.]
MLKEPLKKLKHALGQCVRIATKRWYQYEISPDDATTIFGCSFGDDGWHHIRKTLEELEGNPSLPVHETTLHKYLINFKPSSISSLAGVSEGKPLALFEYPWGSFSTIKRARNKKPENSRFCGPSTEAFINEELARILALKDSVAVDGYHPEVYPNSYISGTWLIDSQGQRRFVVMQGNHRLAVLAHLGYKKIQVRSTRLALDKVLHSDIRRWPAVLSGRCTLDDAEQIFKFFFVNNGRHIRALLER